MPKTYRVMLEADAKPRVGEASNMLGARPNVDIPIRDGQVFPETGGLSVNGCPCSIPPTIAPRGLRTIVPGAKNTNSDGRRLWSLGTGLFTDSGVAEHLRLRLREASEVELSQKGFVEPEQETSFNNYQQAIADTQVRWELDEKRNTECPLCGHPK